MVEGTAVPVSPANEYDVLGQAPLAVCDEATNDVGEDDEAAVAAAATARDEGIAIIRDHVTGYLAQNPNASYVTWIATLHPENAEVTIDKRFNIPGNPWLTVYKEAQSSIRSHGATSPPSERQEELSNSDKIPWCYGGLIPLIVGLCLVQSAVLVALVLEIVSVFFYFQAVLCSSLCGILPLNVFTVIPYGLSWFLLNLFRLLDMIMLLIDIMLVEILAAVSYFVCGLFAGFSHCIGLYYHQQTRRLAHYVRWACRKPCSGYQLPRAYFGRPSDNNNNDIDHTYSYTAVEDDETSSGIP